MGIFTHPPGGAESGLPNPVTLATGIANPRRVVHFWGWGIMLPGDLSGYPPRWG